MFIPFFFIPFLFTACYYDKADKLYPDQAACDTAGMTMSAMLSRTRPRVSSSATRTSM